MSTIAWRLISDDGAWSSSTLEAINEDHILQLKVIFLNHDGNKDGYLNTQQLFDALNNVGFKSRKKLILKFSPNSNQIKPTDQQSSFKTDFKTFVTVIAREVKQLQKLDSELSYLFSFMDINKTGYLSKRDLRHLLMEVETNRQLGTAEFTKFLRSLRFAADTDSISIAELKKQIIFYN
jgi:Ca2+-binding EF-hand superfamily protein